ncbi:hypothetical protein M2163_005751 [Streptomyces sp. SAI-135]|uniref:DUF397 domain-containing protein n=1 Tax=unclassified Streptomyces TaxID=2593676 RepID=UPI002475FB12|nr:MULTISPECIES: DUF397 domain-containing protein [unclassified Streptomyces]MDH6517267.1 hypothetical protein [Streptomyces sp. SAI-090]MDH6568547.1 hypothetical protein [Streptomyces sp. SAI-117]MDH6586504.1 hypothetical protein [Streptomyces sp. SAI-133]MDH6618643.1 hypothetical protein [Streptomyces sp. SAI-135]
MTIEKLTWFKSSYSDGEGGQCLEVAVTPDTIHLRDSKRTDPTAPHLTLSPTAWSAFVAQAAQRS